MLVFVIIWRALLLKKVTPLNLFISEGRMECDSVKCYINEFGTFRKIVLEACLHLYLFINTDIFSLDSFAQLGELYWMIAKSYKMA